MLPLSNSSINRREYEITRVVSATHARVRFGELIRWVAGTHQPVTVEQDGEPYVAVLSVETYRRLQEGQARPSWQETLSRIRTSEADETASA